MSLHDAPRLVHRENTLAAEFEEQGGVGNELPQNVITAYVGNGQLPPDLIRRVDLDDGERLLFCALGAARGLRDDLLASLGNQDDPGYAARAVLDARLDVAKGAGDRWSTMATCVIEATEG